MKIKEISFLTSKSYYYDFGGKTEDQLSTLMEKYNKTLKENNDTGISANLIERANDELSLMDRVLFKYDGMIEGLMIALSIILLFNKYETIGISIFAFGIIYRMLYLKPLHEYHLVLCLNIVCADKLSLHPTQG